MKEILFKETIKIVELIRQFSFTELEKGGYLEKLSIDNVKKALEEYGGVIDKALDSDYELSFNFINIKDRSTYKTYVDFIINGERSDLTLICDIHVCNGTIIKAVIDDIHVL